VIKNIAQLAKINSLLNEVKTTTFNSLLPLKIDVKEELIGGKYKLLVGTKLLETKSNIKLDVGESYWGVMRESSKKGITLSNLLKQPHLLKNIKNIPKFDIQNLNALFTKETPKAELKTVLLEHLSLSSSRSEFMTITSMIEAINNDVFTFVLNQNEKEAIFQFKRRKPKRGKKDAQEETKIDFYAAFSNLGPVEGVVEVKDDIKTLSLYLYYENSLEFLKRELSEIDMSVKLYKKDKTIEPLFNLAPSLLDIRG
jgi:hypothetical protein